MEKCVACLLVYSFLGVFIFPFLDEKGVMGEWAGDCYKTVLERSKTHY